MEEFWIRNISNRNVCIGDLRLSIPPFVAINLFDTKRYRISKEDIQKSFISGSLSKKKDYIIKINNKLESIHNLNIKLSEIPILHKPRKNVVEVTQEIHDELLISDEDFAKENADFAEDDRKPVISK